MKTCVICKNYTFNVFNIQFTATAICESCASTISLQQINAVLNKAPNLDPSKEVTEIYEDLLRNTVVLDQYLSYPANSDTKEVNKVKSLIEKGKKELNKLGYNFRVFEVKPNRKTKRYDLEIIQPFPIKKLKL